MAGILAKTVSVLQLTHAGQAAATYDRVPDDGEDLSVDRRIITIDRQSYHDLGAPDEITVTIEPGDTLNDKEST